MVTVIQSYFKHMERKGLSEKTVRGRKIMFKRYKAWLAENEINLLNVTPVQLEEFQTYLSQDYRSRGRKVSLGTVGEYTTALRMLYRFLHSENKILSNPAIGLQNPKRSRRIHRDVMTRVELGRLLDKPDQNSPEGQRDLVVLRILAFSGLRLSELFNLNLCDLNLQERELIIRRGKGNKDRLSFIDKKTQELVAKYLIQGRASLANKQEQALIVRNSGQRSTADVITWIIKKYRRSIRLRKKISPHSFRRTFCSMLLKSGCNLKAISELAGHKRLSTTGRYQSLDLSDLQQAYRQAFPRD